MKTIISNGNSKIGKIPNVSLTPIKSCGNCEYCKSKCYALKAYRQYKNVRSTWDNNFLLAMTDREKYFRDIAEFLDKKKPNYFRWHVAGDILDSDYLVSMIDIANKHKEIKFLAFTKMHDIAHKLAHYIPRNLSLVMSQWPSMPVGYAGNYFPSAWCQDGTENRINEEKTIECPGHCDACGMCWNLKALGKGVVFHIH